jgi:hypothetical protein
MVADTMQKTISRQNSSQENRHRNLASTSLAEMAKELLERVANLGDNDLVRFQKEFPYVLEELPPRLVLMEADYGDSEDSYPYYAPAADINSKYKYWLLRLRDTLRAIWRAPDRRTKQWGMFRISQDFFLQGNRELLRVPLDNSADYALSGLKMPSRTELLLLQFTRWSDLTRYCDNPECSAPYFIARDPRQKYCLVGCAKSAQREYKQRWWAENGRNWRASRLSKKK